MEAGFERNLTTEDLRVIIEVEAGLEVIIGKTGERNIEIVREIGQLEHIGRRRRLEDRFNNLRRFALGPGIGQAPFGVQPRIIFAAKLMRTGDQIGP